MQCTPSRRGTNGVGDEQSTACICLVGKTKKQHQRQQEKHSVMNCAAPLVCNVPRREHVIPFLVELHWLPVECRIEYKIAPISYKVIICTAPPYLCDLLEL